MKIKISSSSFAVTAALLSAVGLVYACGGIVSSGEVRVFISPDLLGITQESTRSQLKDNLLSLKTFLPSNAPLNAAKTNTSRKVSCVGLNVMGPNISSPAANEGAGAWNQNGSTLIAGGKCGYAGVVSQILPVSTSAMIKVAVPYGNNRVVQLVGYTGLDCSKKLTATDLISTSTVPGVYEIGRAISDIFSRKPEIEILVDTTVIDRIETPNTNDKSQFVPDLRCGVVGNEEKQFQTLTAGGTNSGTPAPTPTPTPTATPPADGGGGTGGGGTGDGGTGGGDPTPCPAGQYSTGGECVGVGLGYYSTGDGVRKSCTNKPNNSSYSNPNQTTAACQWACNANYYEKIDGAGVICSIVQPGTELFSCAANEYVVGLIHTVQANTTLRNLYLLCSKFINNSRTSPSPTERRGGADVGAQIENICSSSPAKGIAGLSAWWTGGRTDGVSATCRSLEEQLGARGAFIEVIPSQT